ncbi:hypothetical protein BDF14DRAFT_1882423 [Spinellus fusiger]|nr:hypothetical protein BDF14DRAFT_1882423 [Spinellus fusiger]
MLKASFPLFSFCTPRVSVISRRWSTSGVGSVQQDGPQQEKGNTHCRIPTRGLLAIQGPDTAKFLQGLTTNNTRRIAETGSGVYTGFLTPQASLLSFVGRMLYDAFIYPMHNNSATWIIECSESQKDALSQHLKRYLLRSKVKIEDVTHEYGVWSLWGPDPSNKVTGGYDTRAPGMGYRAILPKEQDIQNILTASNEVHEEEYTIRRLLKGVPEGPNDVWPEQSLPLEANLDYMHGVDFNKGCYVGQELTIRTHHTGVVRKRLMPVQFYSQENDSTVPTVMAVDRTSRSDLPPPQTDIKLAGGSSKRSVGKTASSIHNIGLALMRLEHVEALAQGQPISFQVAHSSLLVRPFLPDWWPSAAFSNERIEHLKHCFNTYTQGNDMTPTHLGEVYKKAGKQTTTEELEAQIKASNANGQTSLTFDEFVHVMAKGSREESAFKIFDRVDSDKDGLISSEDLEKGLALFGESATLEELQVMIKAADVDGDGLLNYEEFLKILGKPFYSTPLPNTC